MGHAPIAPAGVWTASLRGCRRDPVVAGLLRGGRAGLGSRLGVEEDGEGALATGGGGARRRTYGGRGRANTGRLRAEVEALREEARVVRQERDKAVLVHDTLLHNCNTSFKLWEVQAKEVEQLWARLTWEAAGSLTGTLEFAALSVQEVEEFAWGLHQAGKSESCRQEWLLRKVAGMRLEVLGA
ncbi:hypothetical protein C0992_009351 [Termitomyces sp. T32_za158]|nr:hypothetical protein C0992_009351 [Termitomyces sp. T32_za158]